MFLHYIIWATAKDVSLPRVLSVPTLSRPTLQLASMLSSMPLTGVVTSSALTFRLASMLVSLCSVVMLQLRMSSVFLQEQPSLTNGEVETPTSSRSPKLCPT